jgi:acyl-CoA reductase-like NAD-dependent aldehyde dehydrogenase
VNVRTRITSFVGGSFIEQSDAPFSVQSPIAGGDGVDMPDSSASVVDFAVLGARGAYEEARRSTVATRAAWLMQAAAALEQRSAEIAELIVRDIGKPIRSAAFEVGRGVQLLRGCAAEIKSLRGEVLSLDSVDAGAGRFGFTRRIPYGVVGAVTPFNAPLNLLLQKVGPALVMGNAVVVKPHPAGARVALALAQLFAQAGLPAGLFNVVLGDRAPASALAAHGGVDALTFTGGTAAGDALARAAGAKKFIAEMGSNAANIVMADAQVADAAKRIAAAAFEASGQQCISAQRVLVEASRYDAFMEHFIGAARALKVGDPWDKNTDIGPMISPAAADRLMSWIDDAVGAGANYVLRAEREGCLVSPAIVDGVSEACALWRDEAFGPVAVVRRFEGIDEALALANDSPFGLQGAVFTSNLATAYRFADDFDVGSLWINEASRFRLDAYPFGGVKRSGFGREGLRYAMEDLSQVKFIGIRADVR